MLDYLANISVGLKIRIVLLVIGVLPPLFLLILMHIFDFTTLKNGLALFVAFSILIYYPTVKVLEELIVLRLVRRINAYVEEVKAGRRTPRCNLPAETGDEHGFLRLQRNVFWMVQGLLAREAKLKSTMEKLENAARRDGLTEIWNRRYFMELGHRELVRTSREKTYISLIYFDLDHFKSINDTYGHAAGDKVLMTLAQVVSSELRELDVFGRMGGEEFAVLLPGTNTEGAFSVAEKLRAAIEKQQIAHQEATLRCTASFGLTAKNGNKIEIDDFIKKADKAMYRAKVQGRNRIVVD